MENGLDFKTTLKKIGYAIGTICIAIFLYLSYKVYVKDLNFMAFLFFPASLGIVFENWRLNSQWKKVFKAFIVAFVGSCLVSISDQDSPDDYFFTVWPVFFLILFALTTISFNAKKLEKPLTEGDVLLHSLAIGYLLTSLYLSNKNHITAILLAIGSSFAAASVVSGFIKNWSFGNTGKILMSFWSALVLLVFSVPYVKSMLAWQSIVSHESLNVVLNLIQFFIFGTAIVYIVSNSLFVILYLPFFGKDQGLVSYYKELNQMHIKRFSDFQISILDCLLAVCFSVGVYYLNYRYQWLETLTIIWLVLFIFPKLIWMKNTILAKI